MAFPPTSAPMPPAPAGGPMPPAAPPMGAPSPARSQFHTELVQRLRLLAPPDREALKNGISPEAAVVLIKLFPELKALIAQHMAPPQGAAMPAGGAAPMPQPGPQFSQPRPATKLGQF